MRHHSMLLWPARLACYGLTWLIGGLPLCAQESPAPIVPTKEVVSRWIQDLDAEAYAAREAASKQLLEAGPAAIELLAQAVADPSAEAAARASAILQRIADGSDEATLSQISSALQKLASKRTAVVALAAEIEAQQQKFKHTRAVAHVRALGGGLTGNIDDLAVPRAEAMLVAPAVAVEDVAIVPGFAIDEGPAVEIPEIEEPAPPKRGIVGLLGRLLAPAPEFFPPADLPPPIEVIPDPIPVARDAVPPAPLAEREAAPDVPRFDAIPPLPEGATEVPVAGDAAPDIAAEDIAILEPAVFAPVPIMFDGEPGEGEAYAELTLSQNFRGSDKDLALLKDIPEIYSLSIHGAKLTDEALAHIAALPRLTTLNVRETPFTSAALRKLRQQRPELSVICRSSAMLGINAGLEGPCVLTSVFFKSGAHDAGLRDGDEILEVDGQPVRDFSDLTIAVYPHKPSDKVSVKFRRGDEEQTASVLLKSRAAVEE